MAGIQHLKDMYDTKGMDFIKNLFSKNVYITEKIDGSRFSFKREGDNRIYYKRDSSTPISMIDRTIMAYYEPAISYIESLRLVDIPENITFGFEYFVNSKPGSIIYDKLPKNGLIITDISENGTLNTNIDDLIKYSKLLNVSPPPIIHMGPLSSNQISRLEEFLMTSWEELFAKFKTESFTTYIISILNPKLKNTALNIGINKPIEGIVFSFDNGDSFINTKVVDPLYTEKARLRAKDRFTPEMTEDSGKLKLIMKQIVEFLKSASFEDIKLKSNDSELRYIELLSNLFYTFYELNKSQFSDISEKRGGEIKELDINYGLMVNPKLVSVLKSNEGVKNVFKTYLSSFGKARQRETRILDSSLLNSISSLKTKFIKLSESKHSYHVLMENNLENILNLLKNA